jgi:tetratricopeptide (TPR) repeat protein
VAEGYSLREVGKLLGISRAVLCGLVDAGFVSPARGSRREYRFSFHDLIVLRAAQGLREAKLPAARILRSLRRLRAQLPDRVPLSGLHIEAVGDSVVVSEGQTQWRPDDGQYIFRFQVESPSGGITSLSPAVPAASASDSQWFAKGWELETTDAEDACAAYRRAIGLNAKHVGAYTNLGRVLHELGRMSEAEDVYRSGIANCGGNGLLLFNLAILMEDLARTHEACEAYRAALRDAPDLADAHYNLALLCESEGLRKEALRHLSAFRKLSAPSDPV